MYRSFPQKRSLAQKRPFVQDRLSRYRSFSQYRYFAQNRSRALFVVGASLLSYVVALVLRLMQQEASKHLQPKSNELAVMIHCSSRGARR
jgi:hypothetical protein